jgi:hypothetical protein
MKRWTYSNPARWAALAVAIALAGLWIVVSRSTSDNGDGDGDVSIDPQKPPTRVTERGVSQEMRPESRDLVPERTESETPGTAEPPGGAVGRTREERLLALVRERRAMLKPLNVTLSPAKLENSRSWNPRQVRLTPDQRLKLGAILDDPDRRLQEIEDRRHELAWAAYEEAVSRGRFISLTPDAQNRTSTSSAESILGESLGLDRDQYSYVFLSKGGIDAVAVYFTSADAPEYFRHTQQAKELARQRTMTIAEFFRGL